MRLKLLTLAALTFSLQVEAGQTDFDCKVFYNKEEVLESTISLAEGEKNKIFGDLGMFRFFLSSLGNNQVELQSYDGSEPSRSYATARLTGRGSYVELAVWKAEYILEVRCTQK